MNYVEFFNNYKKDVKEIEIAKDFISYCLDKLKLKNVMFNVIIINNDSIHQLNKKYRSIDKATDVITFALEDEKELISPQIRVLGDIYISYDMVLKQALEYSHSVERELCFLSVHGLLHLLGYDHMNKLDEEKMFKKQKELLDGYGIKK